MNTRHKILIVEDEFIIANQLRMYLQSEGYNIVATTDCYQHSVSCINTHLPDLVITDIRLFDDVDGGIKISEYASKHYQIPVIFLSGYADKETLYKAKQTNPNTFLIKPKPLDKSQLLAAVQMALPDSMSKKMPITKVLSLRGKEIGNVEGFLFSKECEKSEIITRLIKLDEISYIETFNHHVKNTVLIRFGNRQKGFLVRDEIEEINKKLPLHFMRTHKSYIANIHKVTGYKLPHYLLSNEAIIPIGEKYKESVCKYFNV